ncbi:MAG: hypothetical protein HYV63_04885 [Candidatus Schekmanbacteria bacterium]|nr:hypothetical protein [Candidatus Schekmanbacteria bacterium]
MTRTPTVTPTPTPTPAESFESGGLDESEYPWQTSPLGAWYGTSAESHHGTLSLRSANLKPEETAAVALTLDMLENERIRFFAKTDMPPGDRFAFLIDGISRGSVEGIEDWDEKVVTVARGLRTLAFTYTRGATEAAEEGIAFVDEIRFPRHEIPATATPTPTAAPAPAPPRPELRIAFAHQGAVGMAWTPSADRRVSRYALVRTLGTPAPALGSGWLVAAIAAMGAGIAAGRAGRRHAISGGARFIAPGQRNGSISARLSCQRQQGRDESRPCRVLLLLSALAASAALAARAGAPAARVDAFAVDATVFTSANRLTTTFVDGAIESLDLDPLDPVVTYVLSACHPDGTCTRGVPVSARVDGPVPGGAHGELISDFSDPALWQPEDTGSALVTLSANPGEQGQADGLQVAVDFADDQLAPAIRLAPDQPLDLSAGNAVLLDLESLDAQEPTPESALVSVELVDRDPAAVAGGEPNPQRVLLSATVPGWLRGAARPQAVGVAEARIPLAARG